jgi:signal transduction histidine kinase
VKRIDVLVRQFLSLAKEEKLELAETDLKELTLKTVRSLSQDEKFRGIEPTITVITENVKCLCDSSKIEQVMLNLLLNARDAVKSGGEVEIILDSFYNKGKRIVKVSVKDTGMGMDEDTLSKVFEPFYTKFEGGTGLGLAICRKIIEDHCGQIEVRSEPGKGSVFTFKLPCN